MMSAPVCENKKCSWGGTPAAREPGRAAGPLPRPLGIGNQALLQRKSAGGGAPLHPSFGGQPGGGGDPAPGPVGTSPSQTTGGNCKSICDRAYAEPSISRATAGTIVCEGDTKCPCVFDSTLLMKGDGPGLLKRGDCPAYDSIVLRHEMRHLPEADCGTDKKLHAARFTDPSKAVASECTHRKESIAEMDAVLAKSGGLCKRGIQEIRDDRAAWVGANCSAPAGRSSVSF